MGIGKKKILLKITSLLLAIILWVYVVNQTSMADNSVNNTPITYNNLGDGLFIEEAPEKVEVRVWGSNSSSLEIVAYVDLEGVGAGVHTLPVKLIPIKNALLTRVNPDSVVVRIGQEDNLVMPVTYEVIAPPPDGYSLISAMILPEECLVRLDEAVENLSAVVAPLNLTGVKQMSEQTVNLELRDKKGRIIEGAVIEPHQVKAYVVVEEDVAANLVNVQARYMGSPGLGYEVTEIVVDPGQVTLLGNQSLLGATSVIFTKAIDIEGIEMDYTSLISLEVPNSAITYPSQVLVTVKVSKIEPGQVEDEITNS